MFEIEAETIMAPSKMIGKSIDDYKTSTYIAYDGEENIELYCVLDEETKKLELVMVRDNIIVEEIPLGPELWFLNYVAFSFDSRFVAIGGRYHDNTIYQNRNVGGLILIYDLLSKKIIVNKTSTLAIWTVQNLPQL